MQQRIKLLLKFGSLAKLSLIVAVPRFCEKAINVAKRYGYTETTFYWLIKDFKHQLQNSMSEELFFKERLLGRKPRYVPDEHKDFVINLRKHNYSADDIVVFGQARGYDLKYNFVYELLKDEGFAPLFRRTGNEKQQLDNPIEQAPRSEILRNHAEKFSSNNLGIMAFLPIIRKYGIDKAIGQSAYPQTKAINKLSSILSFIALKLSNIKRYSKDDLWCMDRGSGLFAGLNVLPKTAWYSSYSDRVTREMNVSFLQEVHKIWQKHHLLSDTANLDFTAIPYWGADEPMENNWSGKRSKALASMLAVLAESPDSGIIDYGDTTVVHKNQDAVVLEYLDFYKQEQNGQKNELKYLVFDSKFTNYENLGKLDENNVKFITIRRRGKNIVDEIAQIGKDKWKTLRVECAGNKTRVLKVHERIVNLKGYGKEIREVIITGHGREKPAIIITNDDDIKAEKIIRKYSHRWLVEKTISEKIEFFHLNRLSSSMVIKVDFDLTMSILAHNLYRIFALETERYSQLTAEKLFVKMISNSGTVAITNNTIELTLKKKRTMPILLSVMKKYEQEVYPWLFNKSIIFNGASTL